MEEVGMTDLQFKSWLRLLISNLERVTSAETKDEANRKLNSIICDLKADLQG